MCVAAIGAVAAVAQSVVSFAAAQQDYQMQAAQWRQNYVNALAAGRDEQTQLQIRMVQEGEAHSQRRFFNAIEGAQIAAEAEVSAATGGVSGVSLNNILVGINRQIAQKNAADSTNYRNTVSQLTHELDHTNTNIQNRINAVNRPTAPNPLGYAMRGVGGALTALGDSGRRTA